MRCGSGITTTWRRCWAVSLRGTNRFSNVRLGRRPLDDKGGDAGHLGQLLGIGTEGPSQLVEIGSQGVALIPVPLMVEGGDLPGVGSPRRRPVPGGPPFLLVRLSAVQA